MPRALILGGTGLIGRACARRLVAAGWSVDVTGRDPDRLPADLADAGARFVAADRGDPAQLATAMGGGADLLVDCICYTGREATDLVPLLSAATSTVMISSKAVYVDADGNHPNSSVAPRFGGPVREDQPTMAPSDIDFNSRDGYGANKVAAELVLLDTGAPVTVVRPSKVHGQGALRPREWVFVKRALDRRPAVLFAHQGTGADHPTAAANIAALVELAAGKPGQRILNSADPDTPSVAQIARTVAERLGHQWSEVPLDDEVPLGWHPWDCRPPIALDMSAATALGYQPVGDYASTVAEEIDWLVAAAGGEPGDAKLPDGLDAEFFDGRFDYPAEDAWLARE
jgi:nucleoside-diphosphate-sugar epimerase